MYLYIYALHLTSNFPQDRVREQRLDALAEHPPSTPTTSSQGALSLAHSAYNASESAQVKFLKS